MALLERKKAQEVLLFPLLRDSGFLKYQGKQMGQKDNLGTPCQSQADLWVLMVLPCITGEGLLSHSSNS